MLVLTENINSSLAKEGKYVLPIHDLKEDTPFKSLGFSNTIISLLKLFSFSLQDLKMLLEQIDILEIEKQIEKITQNIDLASRFTFLGSGPDYGICLEGALKINELAWLPAFYYETEDFFHGKDSYVSNHDHYFLFKNDYACDFMEVKNVLLSKKAKQVIIIDPKNTSIFVNLFYKIYFIYCLNWTLNQKFKRYPDQLRFRDLLNKTKTY